MNGALSKGFAQPPPRPFVVAVVVIVGIVVVIAAIVVVVVVIDVTAALRNAGCGQGRRRKTGKPAFARALCGTSCNGSAPLIYPGPGPGPSMQPGPGVF